MPFRLSLRFLSVLVVLFASLIHGLGTEPGAFDVIVLGPNEFEKFKHEKSKECTFSPALLVGLQGHLGTQQGRPVTKKGMEAELAIRTKTGTRHVQPLLVQYEATTLTSLLAAANSISTARDSDEDLKKQELTVIIVTMNSREKWAVPTR